MDLIPTISYRDPLVGIIALFSLVLLVWFVASAINRYKNIQKSRQLDRFIENFTTSSWSDETEFEKLLRDYPNSAKMLFVVANGYYLAGEYEKSARFLTLILKHTAKNDKNTTANIMLTLSRSFIRLGFLARARIVLIELLHLQPRNENALKELVGIFARINDYSDSIGALEALCEIDDKYSRCASFFENMKALKSGELAEEKAKSEPYFLRERAKVLLANNALDKLYEMACENNNAKHLIDILYSSYPDEKFLKWAESSQLLREIFAAKGLLSSEKFERFELELMSQVVSKNIAEMVFKYRCRCCAKEELDYFAICKKCMALSTCEIEPTLVKKSEMEFSLESFT